MEKIKKNLRTISLLILISVLAVIWYAVFYFESHQELQLVFFDVDQGDSALIQVENKSQVLIDGGPGDRILSKLGRELPFWDRSIDLLVLTHPHADHLDGLVEVLKRYDVDMVLETGVNHSIPEYDEWRRLLKEKNVKVVIAKAGQRVRLSDSAYLGILTPFEGFEGTSPKDIHDAMVVSKLVYASTTVLFMGDAEKSIEYRLLLSGFNLDTDILKIGHHGSKTSTSEEFLKIVSPDIAIIQSGRKNRYGHPAQEVLDRLAVIGAKLFRNDLDGDIRLESDGATYYLKK